jgi:hypothetical protein
LQAIAGRKALYGLHWQSFSKKTLTVEFSEQTAEEVGEGPLEIEHVWQRVDCRACC